jgi:hypothetical protein
MLLCKFYVILAQFSKTYRQKNTLLIYHFLIYNKGMSAKWRVELSGKAKKADKLLSVNAHKAFVQLLMELENGPDCHLKKGRPTYVACWTVDKKNKVIEVYYAGTHEKAPY